MGHDMSKIIPFKKPATRKLGLCQHGHHKWKVVKEGPAVSRQGKLVTVYKCSNCGKQKVKSH